MFMLCYVIDMGNSSSQSTIPPHMTNGKKPLTTQTVTRADVAADDCTECVKDPRSPSSSIPRNSFCSRLLVRTGEMLVYTDAECFISVKKSSAQNETPSQSYGVSLAICDHSVTCHPTQVNTPQPD